MSEKKYSLKFTKLSRYAPTMIANPRERMSKFVSGVSEMVIKECRTDMLINDMDIQGLRDMVVLNFDNGFSVKVPAILLLSSKKIGFQTLTLKEEMVVYLHCIFVLSVKTSMRVDVYLVLMHTLVVVRRITR